MKHVHRREFADSALAGDRGPNVIFILTDDQGPWAAGCYGNAEIRTPNIDRLAATGMRFENFFVATPVCSPSRATLLTGRIPSQHGVHDWISGGNVGPDAIRYMEGEQAYTHVMARHGWTCGISGKWHLGDSQIPQCGFTDWYVHQSGGGDYNAAPMVRNGQLVTETRYITDVITDEALAMLDRYAAAQTPFYLSVHYTAPHSPWTGHPEDVVQSYDGCPFESCPQEPRHPWAISLTDHCLGNRDMLKGYFAAVTAMDTNIGRIIDALEAKGLRENTLVVFLSDNGFSCGHHGFWGKGNGTLPRNMYENSIKVPAVFSQPGAMPQNEATDAMVSAYDFMPTLLDYLGLPVPTDCNLPGGSFAPLLRGGTVDASEPIVIYDEYGPVRMIRTAEWKYVYRHAHGPDELFDLRNDPDERENLAKEPAHEKQMRELKAAMDEWFARYVIPSRDGLREESPEGVPGQSRLVR
jgi:arylsulfatase A-like enzyme